MTDRPLSAFREFLVRLPKAVAGPVPDAVKREVVQVLVSDARGRFVTGTDPGGKKWPPLKRRRPNGGNLPLLDSGLLRASIYGGATATGVFVASNLPYAALHERGGTVRPKRSKYLAIPVTKEAKRAGSPRRFRGDLKFRPVKKKGSTVRGLLYEQKRGKEPVTHYLLVTESVIPARPFLSPSDKALRQIDDQLADHAAKQLPRG